MPKWPDGDEIWGAARQGSRQFGTEDERRRAFAPLWRTLKVGDRPGAVMSGDKAESFAGKMGFASWGRQRCVHLLGTKGASTPEKLS